MEDNNQQNQYGSQNQFGVSGDQVSQTPPGSGASGQQGVPPPPPSLDERVSVRTMASDMQSVRESGGQVPQSQIVDAPQIPSLTPDESGFAPIENATPTTQEPELSDAAASGISQEPSVSDASFVSNTSMPTGDGGSKTKTTLIITGIVLVAIGLGFGAYYLVASLVAPSSSVAPVASTSTGELPVAVTPPQIAQETSTTTVQPMRHVSFIVNPTQTRTIAMAPTDDFASLRGAIGLLGAQATTTVPIGGVIDIGWVDASSSPLQSQAILPVYFPSFGLSLAGMVDPDFTSWVYLDKVGGAKFGFIFKLTPTAQAATTTIAQYIESNPTDLGNMFLATTTVPKTPVFKSGLIDKVGVRYLAYNTKVGRVVEYAFVTGSGSDVYLVVATSYNQMADIIGRLKELAVPAASVSAPAASTTASSTPSAR
jgi:hypothetical protein